MVFFSYLFLWSSSKTYKGYLPIQRGLTIGKVIGRGGSNIKLLREQLRCITRAQCCVKVIPDKKMVSNSYMHVCTYIVLVYI